jgi:hypothetical protein
MKSSTETLEGPFTHCMPCFSQVHITKAHALPYYGCGWKNGRVKVKRKRLVEDGYSEAANERRLKNWLAIERISRRCLDEGWIWGSYLVTE